jgi:hypothetical protein
VTYILDTLGVVPIAPFIILPPYARLRTGEKTASRIVLFLEVLIVVRKHAGHTVPPGSTTTFSPTFSSIPSSHEGFGSAALGGCGCFDVRIIDILLRIMIQALVGSIISV